MELYPNGSAHVSVFTWDWDAGAEDSFRRAYLHAGAPQHSRGGGIAHICVAACLDNYISAAPPPYGGGGISQTRLRNSKIVTNYHCIRPMLVSERGFGRAGLRIHFAGAYLHAGAPQHSRGVELHISA